MWLHSYMVHRIKFGTNIWVNIAKFYVLFVEVFGRLPAVWGIHENCMLNGRVLVHTGWRQYLQAVCHVLGLSCYLVPRVDMYIPLTCVHSDCWIKSYIKKLSFKGKSAVHWSRWSLVYKKPVNVGICWEFDTCWGNVRKLTRSQGSVWAKVLSRKTVYC